MRNITQTSHKRAANKAKYVKKDARRDILRAVYGYQASNSNEVQFTQPLDTPELLATATRVFKAKKRLTGWPKERLDEIAAHLDRARNLLKEKDQ